MLSQSMVIPEEDFSITIVSLLLLISCVTLCHKSSIFLLYIENHYIVMYLHWLLNVMKLALRNGRELRLLLLMVSVLKLLLVEDEMLLKRITR